MTRSKILAALLLLLCIATADAASYQFGNNANGLHGSPMATLVDNGFSLTLAAGPTGAVIDEASSDKGLGINSTNVAGATDAKNSKFSLLGGGLAGQGEFVTLAFDQPGIITEIDLDGVKDEALEYFILTNESGLRINLFDSAANVSIPGAVDDAVSGGFVTGEVIYLLEDNVYDDEIVGLSIPFAAGEVFTLTYAELGPNITPLEPGNGARFQGITVTSVPEPSSALYLVLSLASVSRFRNRTARVK